MTSRNLSKLTLTTLGLLLTLAASAMGASITWSGDVSTFWDTGGANSNWSTSSGGATPDYGQAPQNNDSLFFAATGALNLTNYNNVSGLSVSGLTFTTAGVTINGNSFTLNGNITQSSAGNATINAPLVLGATSTMSVTNSTARILTLGGAVSGAGGISKTGVGILTLSATSSNSYGGDTTVSAGVMNINNFQTGNGAVIVNGGTLNVGGSGARATDAGNATLTTGILTVAATGTLTNGGNIIANGGSMTITGTGTNLGTLTINGGTVSIAATGKGVTGSGALTLNGGTLSINAGGVATASGTTTVNGGVLSLPNSTTAALGSSTSAVSLGGTADAKISLQASGSLNRNINVVAGVTGTSTLDAANTGTYSGTITLNKNLYVDATAGTTNFSGTINDGTGTNQIIKGLGVGTVNLSNAGNGYAGGTVIQGGMLIGPGIKGNIQLGSAGNVGGVYGGSGTPTATLGTGAGQFNFVTGGGFAAYGGDLTLNFTNGNLTWGSGNFVASGSALILGNTNSGNYSVNLQNNINLGSTARTIQVENATVANDATVSGLLTGTASLTKNGAGQLTISQAPSIGALTVGAGALVLTNGGTFSGNSTNTASTITANGNLSLTGTFTATGASVTNINAGATIGGNATVAGTLNIANTLATMNGAANSVTGTLNVASGGLTVTTGSLTLATGPSTFGAATTIGGALVNTSGTLNINATTGVGTNATSDLTLTAGRINVNAATTVSGSTIITAGDLVKTTTGSLSAGTGIRFNSTTNAGTYDLSGTYSPTLGTGLNNVSWNSGKSGGFAAVGGDLTVNLNGGGADNLVWGSTSGFLTTGTLLLGSTLSTGKTTLVDNIATNGANRIVYVENGSADIDGELAGVISGSNTLTKTGAGKLQLSADNSAAFSGGITVSAGTLYVTNANNVGTGTLTFNGGAIQNGNAGAIDITNNVTLSGTLSTLGGNITLSEASPTMTVGTTFTIGNAQTTISNGLVGNFTMTKAGAGTLTLAGHNLATTTGVNVTAGALILAGANDTTGTYSVTGSSTLAVDTAGTGSINASSILALNGGVYAQAGTFTRLLGATAGKINLTGTNGAGFAAYGGNLVVDLGTASSRDNFTWGSTTNYFNAGMLLNSTVATGKVEIYDNIDLGAANRVITVADNTNLATDYAEITGVISGPTRSITKSGAGKLVLSGTNTYLNTLVSQGTLGISNNQALGSGTLTVSGGTLTAEGGARSIANNFAISGSGYFAGDNDLTISGAFSPGGAASMNVASGRTLELSMPISGAGKITKTGLGTMKLTGNSANTGAGFTVSQGVLQLAKTSGTAAVATDLTVNGGTVSVMANDQFATNTNLTVSSGTLAFGGYSNANTLGTVALTNYNGAGSDTVVDFKAGNTTLNAVSNLVNSGIFQTGTLTATGTNNGNLSTVTTDGAAIHSGAITMKWASYTGATTISGTSASVSGDILSPASIANSSTLTLTGTLSLTNYASVGLSSGGGADMVVPGLVTMDNTAGSTSIDRGSGKLTLGAGLTTTSSLLATNHATIAAGQLAITANQTFNIGDSYNEVDLELAMPITGSAYTLTKAGAGTLKLSGSDTNEPALVVNAGTVYLAKDEPATAASSLNISGGTVRFDASNQLPDGSNLVATGGTLNFNNQAKHDFNDITLGAAIITNTPTLVLKGTLKLSGSPSTAGGTFGALELSSDTDHVLNVVGDSIFGKPLVGTTAVSKTGANYAKLTAVSSGFSGNISSGQGSLVIGNGDNKRLVDMAGNYNNVPVPSPALGTTTGNLTANAGGRLIVAFGGTGSTSGNLIVNGGEMYVIGLGTDSGNIIVNGGTLYAYHPYYDIQAENPYPWGRLTNTGTTSILSGTLRVENGNEKWGTQYETFGSSTAPILLGGVGDAKIQLDAGSIYYKTAAINQDITVQAGPGTATLTGAAGGTSAFPSFNGTITMNKDLIVESTGTGITYFNGLITDGAGSYKITKTGAGLAIFNNGSNAYDGGTTIKDGLLGGAGVKGNIALDGGVLGKSGTSGPLNVTLGTGPGEVQWLSNGGFSSIGTTNLTVDIGGTGADNLTWGADGFIASGGTLMLGSDNRVNSASTILVDNIDLNGATRTILVNDTTSVAVDAEIQGSITGTGTTASLTKQGTGKLRVDGDITIGGNATVSGGGTLNSNSGLSVGGNLTVTWGVMEAANGAAIGGNLATNNWSGTVTISGGTANIGGNVSNTDGVMSFSGATSVGGTVTNSGWMNVNSPMTSTGTMTNSGTLTINAATVVSSGGFNLTGGTVTVNNTTLDITGQALLTAGTFVKTGTGSISASGGLLFNGSGMWAASGDLAPTLGTDIAWNAGLGGGFTAMGGNLSIDFAGLSALTFGGDNFVNTGTLYINNASSTGRVVLADNLDLNGGTRYISVGDNTTTSNDYFEVSGNITGAGAASALTKQGAGRMLVDNNLNIGGAVTVSAGQVDLAAGATAGSVNNAGTLNVTGDLATTSTTAGLTTSGTTAITGSANILNNLSRTAGTTTIGGGAVIGGNVSNSGAGGLTISGTTAVAGTLTSSGLLNLNGPTTVASGTNAAGTVMTISGGTTVIANSLVVGNVTSTYGALNISGGSVTANGPVTVAAGITNAGTTILNNSLAANALSNTGTLTLAAAAGIGTSLANSGTLTASGTTTVGTTLTTTGGTTTFNGNLNVFGAVSIGAGTTNFNSTTTAGSTLSVATGTLNVLADLNLTGTTNTLTVTSGRMNINAGTTTTGAVILSGGDLVKSGAATLNASGGIQLNGGTLDGSGTLNADLGTGANQLKWGTGSSSGFGAVGGDLTVTLNSGANLTWNSTPSFISTGTLNLSSSIATNKVVLTNNLDLGGSNRTISVADNAGSTTDYAELSGVITGSGYTLTKAGAGTLVLSGDNSASGLKFNLAAGTMGISAPTAMGTDASIIFAGGYLANTGVGTLTISNPLSVSGSNAISTTGSGIIQFTSPQLTTLTASTLLNINNTQTIIADLAGDSAYSLTKNGAGALVLTASTLDPGPPPVPGPGPTYHGATYINAGAVASSTGIQSDSLLVLNGGVYATHGSFTRALGPAGLDVVRWDGGGGLAAYTTTRVPYSDPLDPHELNSPNNLYVDINSDGPNPLVWDATSYFLKSGSALVLNSSVSNGAVNLTDDINLGNANRTIYVNDNPDSTYDKAVLWGSLSATGGSGTLTKDGPGTLEFTGYGAISYMGQTTVKAGTVLLNKDGGSACFTGPLLIQSGATVRQLQGMQFNQGAPVTLTGTSTVAALLDFNGYQNLQMGALSATDSTVTNASNYYGSSVALTRSQMYDDGAMNIGALTITGTTAGLTVSGTVRTLDATGAVSITDGTITGVTALSAASVTVNHGTLPVTSITTNSGGMTLSTGAAVTATDTISLQDALTIGSSTVTAHSIIARGLTFDNSTITIDNGNGVLDLASNRPVGTVSINMGSAKSATASTFNFSELRLPQPTGTDGDEPSASSLWMYNTSRDIDLDLNMLVTGGSIRIARDSDAGYKLLFSHENNTFRADEAYTERATRSRGVMTPETLSTNPSLDFGSHVWSNTSEYFTILAGADNSLGTGAIRMGYHNNSGTLVLGTYNKAVTLNNDYIIIRALTSRFDTPYDLTINGKVTDGTGGSESDGGLNKWGAASLILTNMDNNWWANGSVYQGRLVMEGKHAAWLKPDTTNCEHGDTGKYGGRWTVYSGATMAGNGTFEGKWTEIQGGGKVQPGYDGIGTLHFTDYLYDEQLRNEFGQLTTIEQFREGKLTMDSNSIFEMELAEPGQFDSGRPVGHGDKIEAYDLVLNDDVQVNVKKATGIDAGRYNILTYTGALTDNRVGNGLVLNLPDDVDSWNNTLLFSRPEDGDYDVPLRKYLKTFSFIEEWTDGVSGEKKIDVRVQGHVGDATLDGMVDVGDLGLLATNYGRHNALWRQADFNLDGVVDVGDLGLLATHYGWDWRNDPSFPPPAGFAPMGGGLSFAGGEMPAAPAGAPVPEPMTLALLALGAGAILRRRK